MHAVQTKSEKREVEPAKPAAKAAYSPAEDAHTPTWAAAWDDAPAPLLSLSPLMLHPKLAIGRPEDTTYAGAEREADRVAEQVTSGASPSATVTPLSTGPNRSAPAWPQSTNRRAAPQIVHDVLRSPGRTLDPAVRTTMEPRLGWDLSDVRVHTGERAAESARAVDALAYTVGRNVVFGAGHNPETAAGQWLMAHELAHVVQVGRGEAAAAGRAAQSSTTGRTRGGAVVPQLAPPVLFRAVVSRPAARRTKQQIFGNPTATPPVTGMTLAAFRTYTREQADWFVEATLSTTDRDDLWRLLLLAEEGPHVLSGIGDLQVSQLRGVTTADLNPLRAFCRATHSSQHTVRIFPPLPALADRIALGRTLITLEAIIPAAVLEVTVSQVQLVQLQTQALIPSLRTYWIDFQPHLEQTFTPTPGARGPEFERVLTFLNSLGSPGLTPLAPLRGANPATRWVRNLHRFPRPMLLRLVTNLGDTSGTKPFVLVLHTGHDAPGAFQQSANLFSDLVLLSPNNLVLMIEGAVSLADITARVPTITSTWGQIVGGVRRISQLLIAGHGSARTVGMAGTGAPTVAGGMVSYPEQSLEAGQPATRALLDALLQHMDPTAARILYAGCLVGSTHVAAGTPAANIPAALASHQSLGAFTEARATAAGIPAGRVQAARASVALGSATSLFAPATGQLALNYPFDPNAFGSASTYASTGREPEGVLRAAVEVGATSLTTAETLLRARLAMAATGGWYDTITRMLVGLALPAVSGSGVNLQRVNELANVAEVPFLVRWPQFNIVAAHFVNRLNPQSFAAAVYTGLSGTGQYTGPATHHTERMRIIIDQGWLALAGAPRAATLLAGILATTLHANQFEAFLDTTVLGAQAAALLPLGGAPTVPQIRLALAWFARQSGNAHVRSFLSAQVLHPPNAPAAFTAAVRTEITAAGRTEREVLDQLGFAPTSVAPPTGSGGAPQPLANLALPGSPTNTLLLTGRPYAATVTGSPTALVRRGPSSSASGIMTLTHGATAHVMGRVGDWAAVDVWGRLGFIHRTDLTAPPP